MHFFSRSNNPCRDEPPTEYSPVQHVSWADISIARYLRFASLDAACSATPTSPIMVPGLMGYSWYHVLPLLVRNAEEAYLST